MIKKEKSFDKYKEINEKVSNTIKKEFNSKLVYKKIYVKGETKLSI